MYWFILLGTYHSSSQCWLLACCYWFFGSLRNFSGVTRRLITSSPGSYRASWPFRDSFDCCRCCTRVCWSFLRFGTLSRNIDVLLMLRTSFRNRILISNFSALHCTTHEIVKCSLFQACQWNAKNQAHATASRQVKSSPYLYSVSLKELKKPVAQSLPPHQLFCMRACISLEVQQMPESFHWPYDLDLTYVGDKNDVSMQLWRSCQIIFTCHEGDKFMVAHKGRLKDIMVATSLRVVWKRIYGTAIR